MNQQNSVNLSVKDFQIIKAANLSFLPGLNCIIGQSNNGKSALMRAAKSCIYNTPGTSYVRLGCNSFAVGLQMNGHTVILQKGANSVYKIDDEIYGKIGRTQLEEVSKALGIKELQINGSNEDINFWDQMEKPFLLDRSETELFRFIVDSGKDNNVTTALKTITQDRQQITKDITVTEGKIAQIEDTIKRQEIELQDADKKIEVYNKVIELGPKIKRVQEVTTLKDKTLQDGEALKNALILNNSLTAILTKSKDILDSIQLNARKLDLVNNFVSKVTDSTNKIEAVNEQLSRLESFKAPNLSDNLDKYKLLSELVLRINGTQNAITELNSKQYPELSSDFGQKAQKLSAIGTLIDNITYKQNQINTLISQKEQVEKELNDIQKEINEIGICPTCGQPFHNN
jgi:DNA repair ATPase RecN